MAYKIADCCISELGTIQGADGDQTGGEYKYKTNPYKWQVVLEWKQKYIDNGTAKLFADLAKQAADNNAVGYSQPRRLTFYVKLKKAKWYPKSIKEKCASDCSASTATLLVAVGYLKNISKLKAIESRLQPSGFIWTGNMVEVLMATGCFTKRTSATYTAAGSQYVKQGSVCLYHYSADNAHVTIACTNGEKVTVKKPTTTTTAKKDKYSLTQVAKWVINGKASDGTVFGTGATRVKQLNAFIKKHNLSFTAAQVQAEVNRLLK